MKKKLRKIALALAVLYLALVGGVLVLMRQPPSVFGKAMAKIPMAMFYAGWRRPFGSVALGLG